MTSANPHGRPWPDVSITGSVQRFSTSAIAVAEWLEMENIAMDECAETAGAPIITQALNFLLARGMVVESDTSPERIGMMADYLDETGRDNAARVFRAFRDRPGYLMMCYDVFGISPLNYVRNFF